MGAYAFAPLHGYMKKTPSFTPKPSARLFEGRMQYAPTRVHEKPARFHISPSGYAENPPDFTHPNRDMPKTRPILDPNPWRRTFRGVCNTPLHGYMKNPPGFRPKPSARNILGAYAIRPYTGTCKIWRVSYFRTRIRQKRTRFYPSQ